MVKRGIGHIEIVLAFVLFIGVLFVALFFFNITNSSRVVSSSLGYTFNEMDKRIETDLLVYNVILLNRGELFRHPVFGGELMIELDKILNKNVRVENMRGEILPSRVEQEVDDTLVFFKIEERMFEGEERTQILILFNEDFVTFQPPYTGEDFGHDRRGEDDETQYSISSFNSKRLISENKTLKLKEDYDERYSELKNDFNLNSVDFGFTLKFDDDTEVKAEKAQPKGVEVFSDTKRRETLRINGERVFSNLKVSVW